MTITRNVIEALITSASKCRDFLTMDIKKYEH